MNLERTGVWWWGLDYGLTETQTAGSCLFIQVIPVFQVELLTAEVSELAPFDE